MNNWYPEADLVIKHPKIYTVALTIEEIKAGKRDFPIIDDGAVAVKGGKIIAVCKASEADEYCGKNTNVIDASGKVLIPGFCESHMHCTWTGNGLRNIDFRPVLKRAEALELVKEKAASLSKGEWFEGNSWNELLWDDPRMITCRELDQVAPDNPCFHMRLCFHVAMVNSAALRAAGITRDTPDPEGGRIGHYDDGEPNGILYENSAMGLVQDVIPPLTAEQRVESLEAVGHLLNSMGITSAIDANLNFDQMRSYGEAYREGRLFYRANLMFYLDSAYGNAETHLRRLDEMDCVTGFGDDMLKLNGVKVTLDGIPATYTACMREPYKTRPDYCGSSVWTADEITKFVCKAQEKGWQFGIHTIGDKATDMALHAFEEANKISPVWDRHHYIIHYVFPHEDQFETMRRLNISAAMQPTIVSEMGEAPLFYEEQANRNQSAGLMFKNGIICGGSSDSPVVSPDPIKGMYYAVTRIDMTSGKILGEESKVTPKEALIMWTKNSAYFMHDENKLGSVEAGNLADMVIVDRDFLNGDIEDIKNTKVETTFLGGKIVYQA